MADNSPKFWKDVKNVMQARDMLDNGHSINERLHDDGETPLMLIATVSNLVDVAEFLLNEGADVNAKSDVGLTCLHCAVQSSSFEMVQLMLSHGADLDVYCRIGTETGIFMARCQPLHLACFEAFPKIVSVLLEKGAEVNAQALWDWNIAGSGGRHYGLVTPLILVGHLSQTWAGRGLQCIEILLRHRALRVNERVRCGDDQPQLPTIELPTALHQVAKCVKFVRGVMHISVQGSMSSDAEKVLLTEMSSLANVVKELAQHGADFSLPYMGTGADEVSVVMSVVSYTNHDTAFVDILQCVNWLTAIEKAYPQLRSGWKEVATELVNGVAIFVSRSTSHLDYKSQFPTLFDCVWNEQLDLWQRPSWSHGECTQAEFLAAFRAKLEPVRRAAGRVPRLECLSARALNIDSPLVKEFVKNHNRHFVIDVLRHQVCYTDVAQRYEELCQ